MSGVTQAEAAKALGITPRRLRQWEREPTWQPAWRSAEGYDVDALLLARAERVAITDDEVAKRRRTADMLRAEERARQEAVRTERVLRESQIAAGLWVERERVELLLAEAIAVARERVMQLPTRLARQVPTKVRARILLELTSECTHILTQLAEDFRSVGSDAGG
jgi:DNA-binding transcriptional MerR regulator